MSERTKLLKKAVLTGVGASSNIERIKHAIDEAMEELIQVGQDLLTDLESSGKNRAESLQTYLKQLKETASRRTEDLQGQVSSKVQVSLKKAVKDLGFATGEQLADIEERLAAIEGCLADGEGAKPKRRRST